jgi:copper chaperone
MSCSGCSGAVDRVLKKLDGMSMVPPLCLRQDGLANRHHCTGVKSYEVNLENQTATVVAGPDLPFEAVLSKIAKTGKKVNSGEVDGVSHSIEMPVA